MDAESRGPKGGQPSKRVTELEDSSASLQMARQAPGHDHEVVNGRTRRNCRDVNAAPSRGDRTGIGVKCHDRVWERAEAYHKYSTRVRLRHPQRRAERGP